jgi:hypothetical protein
MYAFGLGDGERKSAELTASRACVDPRETHNLHHRLIHFVARSVGDDRAVRLDAARYAVEAVEEREPTATLDVGYGRELSARRAASAK